MIYFCLNKSGMLDPVIDIIFEKYMNTCVLYWGEVTKSKIKQAPFFSDKWLVVISSKDVMLKDNASILTNKNVDILCEVNNDEELMKTYMYCSNEIQEFCSNCRKTKRTVMQKWEVNEQELEDILNWFMKFKSISSYKLSDVYIKTYIKWWLFTRKGNAYGKQYGINLGESCNTQQRWVRASEIVLHPSQESRLSLIVKKAKGNESSLISVLNLVGLGVLDTEFIEKSDEYFPEPKYITVNNFPLYLFSGQKRKRKEILNLVYSYRGSVKFLSKSVIGWCNTFIELYDDFINGSLNTKTKDDWYARKGYDLKINSKFKFNLWWECINNISLETVYMIKEKMEENPICCYHSIVGFCRRWLGC